MGCTSCSSGVDGQPKGCKNNGTCGSDGCNKLTVFDWLSNMALPGDQKPFIGVEIRFKNGRKHFYKNSEKLSLSMGDVVATEAMSGHDIGIVTLTGELVKVQMKKKKQPEKVEELPKIYRKATPKKLDKKIYKIKYDINILNLNNSKKSNFTEVHRIRPFDIAELDKVSKKFNFKKINNYAFLKKTTPNKNNWGAVLIYQKI